jgi:hypothetical protein
MLSLFYCFETCDGHPFHFDTAKMVAVPSASVVTDLGGEDVCSTESPSS